MEEKDLTGHLERLIGPLLDREGIELVELELAGSKRRRILRIYVDRPGGITVDECARANRIIGEVLDIEDPIEGSYTLEVSSPGLDRDLKSDRDFHRSTGRKVRVILSSGVTHTGILRALLGDSILLDVAGETRRLERDAIARTHLEVEF
jgi:ribosome maturation factor RimP